MFVRLRLAMSAHALASASAPNGDSRRQLRRTLATSDWDCSTKVPLLETSSSGRGYDRNPLRQPWYCRDGWSKSKGANAIAIDVSRSGEERGTVAFQIHSGAVPPRG